MNRSELATCILNSLEKNKDKLISDFNESKSKIGHFYLDNLLPETIALEIFKAFPKAEAMVLKRSLKEFKYVSAQMNKHKAILEECIYAFQDERVVKAISEICSLKNLFPDDKLYAGGISMMDKGHFLSPHLDNSHDKDRKRWRILNVLYYVSPDWNFENGGHLELWPEGINGLPVLIESKFNRLVIMATHNKSMHSVSKVNSDAMRCCVSNYYFSENPLRESDTYHVTTFRDRVENSLVDNLLKLDNFLRSSYRKIFRKGPLENPHYYKRK